jgi:hypothetical protein
VLTRHLNHQNKITATICSFCLFLLPSAAVPLITNAVLYQLSYDGTARQYGAGGLITDAGAKIQGKRRYCSRRWDA